MSLDDDYDQFRKNTRDGRIFGMALLSVGLIIVALVQSVQSALFVAFSEEAVAKVIAVKSEKIHGGRSVSTVYRPVLRFQSPTGIPHMVTSPETYRSRPAVGERLPIRYDPTNPEDLRGATFWELWGISLFTAGLGALGVAIFLGWRRRQVQAATEFRDT